MVQVRKEKVKTYTQEQEYQIASTESDQDSQVSPSVLEVEVQTWVELISNLVSTILTGACNIIYNVSSASISEEVAHVLPTVLAGWRREELEFRRCAYDWSIVEFGNNHSANKTSERVKLV